MIFNEKFMTVQVASLYLGKSEQWVRELCRAGLLIDATKECRQWRIPTQSVADYKMKRGRRLDE